MTWTGTSFVAHRSFLQNEEISAMSLAQHTFLLDTKYNLPFFVTFVDYFIKLITMKKLILFLGLVAFMSTTTATYATTSADFEISILDCDKCSHHKCDDNCKKDGCKAAKCSHAHASTANTAKKGACCAKKGGDGTASAKKSCCKSGAKASCGAKKGTQAEK